MSLMISALLTVAVFLAAILNLAVDSPHRTKFIMICASVGGVIVALAYGYAFAVLDGLSPKTLLRALVMAFRAFAGVNEYSVISGIPLFKSGLVLTLFWLGHFLTIYVTASVALNALGSKLLDRVREFLMRRGNLILVFGATPETVGLVRSNRKKRGLVFVAAKGAPQEELAKRMGGVAYPGGVNLCASPAFLRTVGYDGSHELDVYCVSDDPVLNLRYAEKLLDALSAVGADPGRLSLFLLGLPEGKTVHLQAHEGHYGYGALFACERHELAARLVIRSCPPWTRLEYDARGRATKDFRAVIVGLGQTGRAVLRELVMNGQMEGSAFHVEVFDPQIDQISGPLQASYPEALKTYDITLRADSAQSAAFYARLKADVPSMIVLCTGSARRNAEYAMELERFYAARPEKPAVIQCTREGVEVEGEVQRVEDIDVRRMDSLAMVLNHVYCNGPSPEADWRDCDPFSRASSRASADFYPAFLYASGMSEADALAGKWPPSPEILENLARTEHLRWCAFHLAMGYRPMSAEEYDARAARFRRGEKLRVSRNTEAMTHACLVPWEALDDLSARENAATGKQIDYKAMDVNNVLALPEIIEKGRQAALEAPTRVPLWESGR